MKEDYSEFPTYENTIKAIEKIKKQKWPKFEEFNNIKEYSEKIEKLIFSEFEIFLNLLSLQKPEKFTFEIFRAREVNSFSNINLYAEHSYPPLNLTNYGRCNFPKYPVFYGSNNPLTSLIEASGNDNYKNRKFCISKWKIQESEKDFVLQTFLHTKLHKSNFFDILGETEIEAFNKSINNGLNESQKKGLKEYLKFLHDSFINDENYEISATLAHRTIYAPHNYATDILIYPSKQTHLRGVNFAIKPNFVDNEMKIERFYIVEIEDYNSENGKFKVTFSKYGEIINNVIFWRNISPDDIEYQQNFKNDFKSMLPDKYELKIKKTDT
ncbi:hypothetical protein G1K75_12590 [Tenacibaculum finnmarkense]|uniref:hypothetical protein n=1 Tax=Tenacibaculum finnmarkense TaxID=2781243 RepID=UPI001EFAA23C|nr:hypothetical protein [Tenacibaculum finnmarkense]MCG8806489.1 hypothetical protein [Tenacibaculum finnmarkense]MCG8857616.1 hypothetical protein [Tenacibaculum finnmarkense]